MRRGYARHVPGERTTSRAGLIWAIRYGLPILLFVAGWIVLFATDASVRWDGWAMCLGAAGALLLLNVLFRYGAKGDQEREDEDAARDYLAEHGHWPDEEPPSRRT
jgi:hypothetical protein